MLNLIANWRRQRETIRELARLNDRELADLGIARADIQAIATGMPLVSRADVVSTIEPASDLRAYDRDDAMAPAWAAHNRRSLAA